MRESGPQDYQLDFSLINFEHAVSVESKATPMAQPHPRDISATHPFLLKAGTGMMPY